MAGITLTQAETKLATWIAADDAVAKSQEYSIGTRKLRRADIAEIRANIDYWDAKVVKLSAGRSGPRITGATPI